MQIVRHLGHEPSLDLPPIGHPFIMGATRMRDVLVNLLTATNKIIRFGLGVGVFGVGLLWPDLAHADVSDTPPHRLELNVAPNLPKCNDYDSFYGIITNWITIRSLNPTAEKKLSISIKRIPKGDKVVYLSVSDPDGVEMFHDMHSYQPSPECFTVLYWTAFDATRLLRQTIPLPEEEPPMSVDELVAEVEKPERVQKKGATWSRTWSWRRVWLRSAPRPRRKKKVHCQITWPSGWSPRWGCCLSRCLDCGLATGVRLGCSCSNWRRSHFRRSFRPSWTGTFQIELPCVLNSTERVRARVCAEFPSLVVRSRWAVGCRPNATSEISTSIPSIPLRAPRACFPSGCARVLKFH